jgi:RNase P/RNase MRP subunit p30
MKRLFADLHLRTNNHNAEQALQLATKAAELGYKRLAIAVPPETRPEETQKLKTACSTLGVDFVSRVDVRPRNPDELLNQLRRLRRKFEVICVFCETKEVARQAAKDRRVDLLNFPLFDFRRRFFDRAEAELACGGCAGFEVDIKPLLLLEGPARVRLLGSLRREAAVAVEFRLPVVVSSGVSETSLMRKPREMAVVASLFGLEGVPALDAVSTNPNMLVERNREKLSRGFVAPGIRVIKQGVDP